LENKKKVEYHRNQLGDAHAGLVDMSDLLRQRLCFEGAALKNVSEGRLPPVPVAEKTDEEVATVDLVDAGPDLSDRGQLSSSLTNFLSASRRVQKLRVFVTGKPLLPCPLFVSIGGVSQCGAPSIAPL